MAAKTKDTKQQKKEKNYKSSYDANRGCYREDETHYVYQEWVKTGKKKGFYHNTTFTVGEGDVTLELLDYLQASDNGEVQDQEDEVRYREKLAESLPTYVKSREEELCSEEKEHISPMLKAFNEKVRPHLSEEQMNLIYARYGMKLSLEEIAAMLPSGKDGKPKTHQAVSSRLNKIIAKVKKYMTEE